MVHYQKILFYKNSSKKLGDYVYDLIGSFLDNTNLVRRFLDKKYITHDITCINAYSGIELIRLLVKYFRFEITNWSYLKNNDLKTCKKMILESTHYMELNVVFLQPCFPEFKFM